MATAGNLSDGRIQFKTHRPNVVVLDLKLPDGDGTSLLREWSLLPDMPPVIMLTGHHDLAFTVEAMKIGAFDYLLKPPDLDQLDLLIRSGIEQDLLKPDDFKATVQGKDSHLVGHSAAMLEIHKQIGRVSRSRAPLLITGESGTGKELVARAIHQHSASDKPFVAVNCSAIVSGLAESEFFGHKRGAFTGATENRIGRFEEAGEGTIFLDEIGDLPIEMQGKLLRVIQEKTFFKVGSNTPVQLRARLVTATNCDLTKMVEAGAFRRDLYFRISPLALHIPPLRDRLEDIAELVAFFTAKRSVEIGGRTYKISQSDLTTLKEYSWPGNVRELENILLQSMLYSSGEFLTLRFPMQNDETGALYTGKFLSLAEMEREHILKVLVSVSWKLGEACEILGISRPTLRKKIADFGLENPHGIE